MKDLEKADKYVHNGRYEKALPLYKKAIKEDEDNCGSWLNMGVCYQHLKNYERAQECALRALALHPEYPDAWNNLGMVEFIRGGKLSEGYFRKAIQYRSSDGDFHWNLALELIRKSGGYNLEGWYELDWRFNKKSPVTLCQMKGTPWDGKAAGRVMLLHEQGFGDNLMMYRYASLGDFYYQAPAPLSNLLPDTHNDISSLAYDYWLPILSLPRVLGLSAPSRYIPVQTPRFNGGIGLVWKGNPNHGNDSLRSRRISEFKWLSNLGLPVYSLQYGIKSGVDWCIDSPISDFKDTASIIEGLDYVVAVDTSVAHLAGAMGKKTYLLLPSQGLDYRWGLEGTTSVWYPSMTLIRGGMDELKKCLM